MTGKEGERERERENDNDRYRRRERDKEMERMTDKEGSNSAVCRPVLSSQVNYFLEHLQQHYVGLIILMKLTTGNYFQESFLYLFFQHISIPQTIFFYLLACS